MDEIKIGTKQLGIIIIIVAVIFILLLVSFSNKLQDAGVKACSCEDGACPMESALPFEIYLGGTVAFVLIGLGLFLVIKSRNLETVANDNDRKKKQILKTLQNDEQKIYETILASGGTMFQAELIEKLGLNKVKVSRILDKLEGQGLIERRRRGMTNIIILK